MQRQLAKTAVIIDKKKSKWRVVVCWHSTFTRGRDIEKFESFEDAYRSAREYNKNKIRIAWLPDSMLKAIKKVEAEISAEKEDAQTAAEERLLLKRLKKKYENGDKKKK